MDKKISNTAKSPPSKKTEKLINGTGSPDELQMKFFELQNKYKKLESEINEINSGKENKSTPRTEKLIEALNSAIFLLQTSHTREEVFEVVAGELKKMDIDSLVMTASDDLNILSLEYFSFQTKLIKAAEKVAKMTIGQLKLNIKEIKEYEDVLVRRKTVFINNTTEFVRRVLPEKLKFMAGQLIKSLRIKQFILAPLIVENRVIGIFSVQGNDLRETDIPEVTMFAHQLAGIWHKVELLENARKEIAEKKLAEEKLIESTRKINTLINNLPGVVYRCLNDKDWTMEYISDGIERLSGYPASDFINNSVRTFNSIIVTDDQNSVWSEIQKGLKDKMPFTMEYKIKTSAGDIRNVWERGVGIYKNGELTALEGYISDITEQKKAQEIIFESEKKYRTIVEQLSEGFFLIDSDGVLIEWNKAMENITGRKRAGVINKYFIEIKKELIVSGRNSGKSIEEILENFKRVLQTQKADIFYKEMALQIACTDGKIKDIQATVFPVYEGNKFFIGFIGRDVTERIKTEKENREYADMIEGIFRVAPAGIGVAKDRIITEVNPRICEMTEYSRDELIGKNSILLYPSQEEYDFVGKEKYDQIRKKGSGFLETKWKKKSGKIINILLASTPLENDDIKKGVIFTALDITSRIQAEEALAKSEAKYKTLFHNSALAIGIRKTDGSYIEFNEAYSKMLGYSCEELKYLSQSDLTHPGDVKITKGNMKLVSEGNAEIVKYEKRYIHKNGNIIWGEVCIQPLHINGGKVEAVIGTVVDITKRKLAEMSLRESEKSFEKQRDAIASLATNEILSAGDIEKSKKILTETASDVLNVDRASIWLLSEDKEELLCIDLFEKSKGVHSSGMILKAKEYPNYFKALKENSQITVYDAQNDFKTREFNDNYNILFGINSMLDSVLLSKDGVLGVICFEHTGAKKNWYPHEESFANTIASLFVKTFTIDEAKKAEKHISMLANALESVNESVSITDTNNDIIFVNQAFTKSYGYTEKEITGKNISILGSDKNPPGIHDKIHSSVTNGLWQGELVNRKKDGTEFPIYLSSAPIFDKRGKTIAYIGVANDITEIKKSEEALRSAKDKAEEMNRIKSSFLANMSHEVRTPLVAILGFSEVLSDIVTEPQIKSYVEMIHAGGVRLLDTLNLILDLSVIESQKVNIRLKPVDIVAEAKDAVSLFRKFAEKKKLKLNIESPYESLVFDTDEKILRQILNNLINNAIKFTAHGGVTVSIGKETKGSKSFLSLRVEDTGIGIPQNKRELIWDEFRQVSEGFNRSFEGAGLGLSITRKFVEKINGEIILEKSEVDIGSVFKVLFPADEKIFDNAKYKKQKTPDSSDNSPTERTGNLPQLLYVDDDPVSLEIVSAFTKDIYKIDTALSGRDGIEKSKSKNYDAMLIDINLGSELDGLMTLKIMRELKNNRDIPAVAVTAFAMKGDKEKFLNGGFTHYLSKPFDKKDLLSLLSDVFKNK
ncbi:MAG: PAS domain S-box protein [Ignavibacteriae bacterium]|nr:PAS domain S-box protein [Ignavibacteriota bacterium]